MTRFHFFYADISKLFSLVVTAVLKFVKLVCMHYTGRHMPLISAIGMCVKFAVNVEKVARSAKDPFSQPFYEPRSFRPCMEFSTMFSCKLAVFMLMRT